MRSFLPISLFLILISGCSVHQAWNGDKKPGLSYISIDKTGAVVSNNKSTALFLETIDKLQKEGDKEALKKFIEDNNKRSTLFIWSAEYNGAMINGSGSTCLQAASYARSTDVTAELSSSLITAFTQIDLRSSNENDKLLALNISEAISNLTASSEQSTYLSAGLFGLCLLHANGALKDVQVKESIEKLIKASSLADKNITSEENKKLAEK